MSISVVIPVGPFPANKRWLGECLDSVAAQSILPNEVILIDDGAQLDKWPLLSPYPQYTIAGKEPVDWYYYTREPLAFTDIAVYKTPWRTGVSHAFNYGIALSTQPCVFMLGSDDTLEPTCLERCLEAYYTKDKAPGYYSVPVRYMNTNPEEIQTLPCNAAMVTRDWFLNTVGGFPIQTAIGRGDSAVLSICMKHNLPVYWVGHITNADLTPLYNYRTHPEFWTAQAGRYHDELTSIVNKLTEDYDPESVAKWTGGYHA